jgi:hypothetical protein
VSIGTGTGAAQQQLKPEKPRRPGNKWKLAITGLIVVFVALAGYDLVSNFSQLGVNAATSATPAPRTAAPTAGGASTAPRSATATPAPSAAASPASQPASRPLEVVSVVAFGPGGTSDGDNPGLASRILDVSTDQPWYTQWYATPEFGGLRSGTGLLLDLGETVTVRDVQLVLGAEPGADIQVGVGNSPSTDLPTMASTSGAGGTVRLTATAPARGRYVLIWFTQLPPDGQGHYQVSVYSATVDGTAGG